MSLNHTNVNATDNNLAEISEAQKNIAAELAKISGGNGNPPQNAQDGGQSNEILGRVQESGNVLGGGSGGGNHAKVYGGMIEAKLGLPSVELASAALGIALDRGGVFKAVKTGFEGKKNGYHIGSKAEKNAKLGKFGSIKTGPESKSGMLAFKTAVTSDSITSSSKGVQASKAGAPQTGGVKKALQQKLGHANQAEHQVHHQIHNAMQMGGAKAPALVASLKNGPKFKMSDKDIEQTKADNNIWGSSDTA